MRLLHRTTLVYLLFSTVLLVVAGLFIYHRIKGVMEEEVNEKLLVEQERIAGALEDDLPLSSLPPVMEIIPTDAVPSGPVFKDTLLMDPVEEDMEHFREVSSVISINGQSLRISVRQVVLEPHDYYYSIGMPLAVAFLVLLTGLVVIQYIISRNTWTSFRRNLELIKQFSVHQPVPPVLQPSSIREFKELNQVIGTMMHTIVREYTSLKEFTANAAHELQTPLAVISARLETLLQEEGLNENQHKLITSAYASARKLSGLSKALLLLAKIENRQFNDTASINLAQLVRETLAHFESQLHEKEIMVTTEGDQHLPAMVNKELAGILITNLVWNAIRHNIQGGSIHIAIHEKQLLIRNTGEPFTGDGSRIFERFSRPFTATSGNGLGLAIVKEICKTYNWEISYTFSGNLHIFTVSVS